MIVSRRLRDVDTRRIALSILEKVGRGGWASPLIEQLTVEDRDRRFIRTLVMAVLRWRLRVDWVITQLTGRSIRRLDEPVLEVLRLGVAQLMYTDVSPHAAVNETVNLAVGRAARGRGLVNAVLRKAASQDLSQLAGELNDAVAVSHPEWMLDRWKALYGSERALQIATSNQKLSRSDLLVNTRLATPQQVLEKISERGASARPSTLIRDVLNLEESTAAVDDLLREGLAYAMDEGSVIVGRLVAAAPGERVLDMCAAPGGKTLVMALDGGRVISHDISWQRLSLLRRLAPTLLGREPEIVVGDGSLPPFSGGFGKVLVDAPCSATGTIRRNPEIKWRLTPEAIRGFVALQEELLSSALSLAATEVVYATCSLEREENDEVVAAVLARTTDWEVAPAAGPSEPALESYMDGAVLRLTPESGTDGFTVHRLVRRNRA